MRRRGEAQFIEEGGGDVEVIFLFDLGGGELVAEPHAFVGGERRAEDTQEQEDAEFTRLLFLSVRESIWLRTGPLDNTKELVLQTVACVSSSRFSRWRRPGLRPLKRRRRISRR